MTDLIGRKVRLTGPRWDDDNGYPRRGSIHTITHQSRTDDMFHAGRAMSVLDADGVQAYLGFEVELLPARERILVHSWITAGDDGGFDWVPMDRDPGGAENLTRQYLGDRKFAGYRQATLAEISVAGYAPDEAGCTRVTEFLEGEWQDAVALGLVGKIISQY